MATKTATINRKKRMTKWNFGDKRIIKVKSWPRRYLFHFSSQSCGDTGALMLVSIFPLTSTCSATALMLMFAITHFSIELLVVKDERVCFNNNHLFFSTSFFRFSVQDPLKVFQAQNTELDFRHVSVNI